MSTKQFSTSFLVGLLALPLAAAGATALVASQSPTVDELAAASGPPPAFAPAAEVAVTEATVSGPAEVPSAGSDEDLARACGPAGLDLVEREATNELTDLEQAALDALRAVCETEGLPLPGPPTPAPVVKTVTVAQSGPASATFAAATSSSHDDADHENDDRDDDHDNHDHDNDDHDDD